MKTRILAILVACLLFAACETTTVTTMRGKEVVKVEKTGSHFADFLGHVLGSAIAGTATHYFRADPERVGLRK